MKFILILFLELLSLPSIAQPLPKLSEYPEPDQRIIKKFKVKSITAIIPSLENSVVDTVQFFYNKDGRDTAIYVNNYRYVYKNYLKDKHGRLSKVQVSFKRIETFMPFETYTYDYSNNETFRVFFSNIIYDKRSDFL